MLKCHRPSPNLLAALAVALRILLVIDPAPL
jgi:hypothetical protein